MLFFPSGRSKCEHLWGEKGGCGVIGGGGIAPDHRRELHVMAEATFFLSCICWGVCFWISPPDVYILRDVTKAHMYQRTFT